jgi:hypothetical protein
MSQAFSLAGFEVTLIGRFWVIPEETLRSSPEAYWRAGPDEYRRRSSIRRERDSVLGIRTSALEVEILSLFNRRMPHSIYPTVAGECVNRPVQNIDQANTRRDVS